ncbi:MAG: hypothetical protein PHW82_17330, partial [Bacteroidales bacterium]|nr:hypothetical protein [Bacteroidales bacterium]
MKFKQDLIYKTSVEMEIRQKLLLLASLLSLLFAACFLSSCEENEVLQIKPLGSIQLDVKLEQTKGDFPDSFKAFVEVLLIDDKGINNISPLSDSVTFVKNENGRYSSLNNISIPLNKKVIVSIRASMGDYNLLGRSDTLQISAGDLQAQVVKIYLTPDNINGYNGTYMGFGYDGSTKVVCWKTEITNGIVSGIAYSGSEEATITGIVNDSGQVTFTATTHGAETHQITATASISGGTLTGTWQDDVENDNGIISGDKVTAADVSQYNGTYNGFAYDGATRVGSWKIEINNGFITPISTSEQDNGAMSGIVNGQGQVTAMSGGGGEDNIDISANISGNNISGTWIDV